MEYISYNDKLFIVKRRIKEQNLKPNIDLTPLKILWQCDSVLRKQGIYYFCNEIKEVSYEKIRN